MLLETIVALSLLSFAFSSREYIYVDQELSQSAAEAYCASTYQIYNGHLASIQTETENDEVADLCPDQAGKKDGCTIGLERDDGALWWTDGQSVTYTNWGKDQPKFASTTHPTVIIKPGDATYSKGAGLWRVTRDIEFPFICQKDRYINACGGDYLIAGDRLTPDEPLYTGSALVSPNRNFMAVLQSDGNFVVYDISSGCSAKWDTDVYGTEQRYLVLQEGDGNLVLYSVGGGHAYASNVYNSNPGMLVMQNDGNLVAYTTDHVAYWDIWSLSGTFQAFVNYFDKPGTQETLRSSVSLLGTLIAVFTCVLLVCVYGIKYRANKEYQPLLDSTQP